MLSYFFFKGRDHLAIVILTILTMEFQIKMKKILKKEKAYGYILILID
jgi:hypothetical protein